MPLLHSVFIAVSYMVHLFSLNTSIIPYELGSLLWYSVPLWLNPCYKMCYSLTLMNRRSTRIPTSHLSSATNLLQFFISFVELLIPCFILVNLLQLTTLEKKKCCLPVWQDLSCSECVLFSLLDFFKVFVLSPSLP